MSILVGTAGYSYEEWRGVLYPSELPKEDFLRYYALFFPFVELDFSYYQMPEAHRLGRLGESVPRDFRFAIKGNKALTHEIKADWPAAAAAFAEAVAAPAFRDRLAAVLLQFPYSFHYTDPNRLYLGELTKSLAGLPLAIEFRNAEWNKPAVYAEAKKRGLCLAAVDTPALPNLPAAELGIAADLRYVRFHGRNSANWWNGNATSRYDYLYSDAELLEWRPRVLGADSPIATVLVAFNNHYAGNAVVNARRFKELLVADAKLPS
jgi:uncharacterized protein YecE (DUF72 family)